MLNEIKKVINEIKKEYPDLYISCDYLSDEDTYEIWHNNSNFKHDKKFKEIAGKILFENLFFNGITNFFLDYNEDKSIEIEYLKENNNDYVVDGTYLENILYYKDVIACNDNYALAA